MKAIYLFITLLFITTCISEQTSAQESKDEDTVAQSPDREKALRVFLDCYYCDSDFIKRQLPFVNYVRDRHEAQVHILVTRQSTGSGGREYKIIMLGQEEFEGIADELTYVSSPDETYDMTRQGRTRIIAMGLMQFVAKTPMANMVNIGYNGDYDEEQKAEIVEDKWNSWVFDIDLSGEYQREESRVNPELEADFSIEKITPDWKVEFAPSYDYYSSKYFYEDTIYTSKRNRASFRHLLVKSLNDHWSAGGRIYVSSDSYRNSRLGWSIYPAVEYNVYPYQESSRKQLRFQYRMGYGYTYYEELTIYDKMEEGLFGQQLSIAYGIRQPWGSINASLSGFTFLHDLSKNNVQLRTSAYIRILKGLSLNLSCRAAIIHDQLSLTKEGATAEEVLLRQQQIASQYNYSFKVGFSYTFGSIYNNVVNPRFGDR
ncbi:MAG: hypothetical protein HN352_13140 [Bacteroidetes bacterium]|jgi:hypothetical protein|nr:hypothetical protein [Bacteroidota bacterium]MBT4398523.1 hypothetical protein [Bacteroidota bacterium]MBT7463396.1 hypothetical protein [Bacteroidota bacterium]